MICAGGWATSPERIPGGATAAPTRSCTATVMAATARRCSGCGARKAYECLPDVANVAGSVSPPHRLTGCTPTTPTTCGRWTTSHVHRAVDQHGRVIDVYVSQCRDIASARMFFTTALAVRGDPAEVITDRAPVLAYVIEELVPAAWHNTGQYQNNRVECDHGRLKSWVRMMRGLKTHRTAGVVILGHVLIQNFRRGHDELAVDATRVSRLATAFDGPVI